MKTIWSIFLGAMLWLMAGAAFAESIPYEFSPIDIFVPGSSTRWIPEDINDQGVILTNVRIDNLAEAVIAKADRARKHEF